MEVPREPIVKRDLEVGTKITISLIKNVDQAFYSSPLLA